VARINPLFAWKESLMSRALARAVGSALFACFTITAAAQSASPIADKNLDAAIRAVLFDPKGDLTDEMLKNVFVLNASGKPGKEIKDLTGLEKCINLAEFKASNNQITDLKPMKGLSNLQSLDLSGNQITDIGPLAGLTKLQYIELSKNKVADISALKNLTALSALYLNENQISDLTPLAGLGKLSSLSLSKNKVKDLSPLAKVNRLMVLDLNENEIADISPLKSQGELAMLMLTKNKISDLAALVAAAEADANGAKRFAPFLRLWLAGNPLSEDAKTKQLPALKAAGVRIQD
jgi:Leucine-rich repeat (LRR) protein